MGRPSMPSRLHRACDGRRIARPHRIGFHAALAIVEEAAKDPTLAAFDPALADILVVPANGVPPDRGPGEAEDDHPG